VARYCGDSHHCGRIAGPDGGRIHHCLDIVMFAALVNEGERVILPSGRIGVVIGRGEGHRFEIAYEGADPNDTVLLKAHLLRRFAGVQPLESEFGIGD